MRTYDVTLRDRTVESVAADAYQQEGPMTTFFRLGEGRDVVDCWADRVASIRTADILVVRLAEGIPTSRQLRAVEMSGFSLAQGANS